MTNGLCRLYILTRLVLNTTIKRVHNGVSFLYCYDDIMTAYIHIIYFIFKEKSSPSYVCLMKVDVPTYIEYLVTLYIYVLKIMWKNMENVTIARAICSLQTFQLEKKNFWKKWQ